jgi:hypothetical protein
VRHEPEVLHPETHDNGFPKKKVSVETGLQYPGMSSLLGLVGECADGVHRNQTVSIKIKIKIKQRKMALAAADTKARDLLMISLLSSPSPSCSRSYVIPALMKPIDLRSADAILWLTYIKPTRNLV